MKKIVARLDDDIVIKLKPYLKKRHLTLDYLFNTSLRNYFEKEEKEEKMLDEMFNEESEYVRDRMPKERKYFGELVHLSTHHGYVQPELKGVKYVN